MAIPIKLLLFKLLILVKMVQTEAPEWTWPGILLGNGKCFCHEGVRNFFLKFKIFKNECKELKYVSESETKKRYVCPPPACTTHDDCSPCKCLIEKGYCEPYPFKEENAKCETHFECGDGKLCSWEHKCQKIMHQQIFTMKNRCKVGISKDCASFEYCFLDPGYNKNTGICLMKTSNTEANNWLETEIKWHLKAHHLFPKQNSPQLRLKWH